MVGLLTCPISWLADRFGRAKSITVMAVLWSAATLLCGLARITSRCWPARVLVGVGEAAYGSVGIAVIISVFPKHLRATLTGAFMAGGLAGQVLGVGIGGVVAAAHGWRTAFVAIGALGLVLAAAYAWFVRESSALEQESDTSSEARSRLPSLRRCSPGGRLKCAYVGSGLQLFVAGALPAWLPTYFVRYYDLPLGKAAPLAAIFLALGGAGMVICGMVSDRLVRDAGQRALLSTGYCIGCAVLSGGGAQRLARARRSWCCSACAMFLAAATAGPAGAMVANLTPAALHGTAFAILTLANNVFGLAPGPIVTGWLADRIGLLGALQWLPAASIAAALVFFARLAQSPQPELSPSDRMHEQVHALDAGGASRRRPRVPCVRRHRRRGRADRDH